MGGWINGGRTPNRILRLFFSTVPNAAAWVDRAWTAPMKTRCRLPSVRHWGCAEHGELPPTRGVGRSSAIVRRLRFPLISFSFLSLQFLSGLEGLQKWDAPRGRSHGRNICLHRGEFHGALPSKFHRTSDPSFAKEARGAGGQWQVRICRETVFLRFSSSQPRQLAKKSLPEISSQLSQPTILINQRLLQRFSFASQLWLRAVGLWSAPTALECRTAANHGNATECRWRCRPLTTGGGLAACGVDAGGSS